MIISISEILSLILTSLVIGFIFMDRFTKSPKLRKFDFRALIYASLIVSPGIILHELMHKFVALFFGISAVFKIFPIGIILAIVLKLVNSPFILIAPGYVEIGNTTDLTQLFFVAFSGPLINLILFIIALIIIRKKKLSRNQHLFWYVTKQINIILFIFNMLPIPPLDGSKVWFSLYKIIFN